MGPIRNRNVLGGMKVSLTISPTSEYHTPSLDRLEDSRQNSVHQTAVESIKNYSQLECGFWVIDGRDAKRAVKRSILESCFLWVGSLEGVRRDLFRSRSQSLIDLHLLFCPQLL